MNKLYGEILARVEVEIKGIELPKTPTNLYDPIRYIMGLGGKRVRPVLTLLGNQLYKGNYEDAIHHAMAVEMFHNFTLVHDDVMDSADVRRGLPTVHKKWSSNIALLSGDGMLVAAYGLLQKSSPETFAKTAAIFTDTALQVCEGQQLDMDFAELDSISMDAYLGMIRQKTAVLLSGSLKIGAIVGGAHDKDLPNLESFAESLGLAFQVKDDYLDAFGSSEFGKVLGGDIIEGKRTWLTVKSLELLGGNGARILHDAYAIKNADNRVKEVLKIYHELGIEKLAQQQVQEYSNIAQKSLVNMNGDKEAINTLSWLVDQLIGRTI
jgi:geranylgeranyl diphosphate synthase type II